MHSMTWVCPSSTSILNRSKTVPIGVRIMASCNERRSGARQEAAGNHMAASVKDVAALAGVSVGTVSNVMNRP